MNIEHDAVLLSDLHLGSDLCQTQQLLHFLEHLPQTRQLILVGDVLQSTEYRLKEQHWRVLSQLRQLSAQVELVWVQGNHDSDAKQVASLIGATFTEEYLLVSGNLKFVCIHGHQWDSFVVAHPRLTWVAERAYLYLQRLFPKQFFRMKRNPKTLVDKVRQGALKYGASQGVDAIICGHVHRAEASTSPKLGDPAYYNCGSWIDPQCHYLTVLDGQVTLRVFADTADEQSLAAYCLARARRIKKSVRVKTVQTNNWLKQVFPQ